MSIITKVLAVMVEKGCSPEQMLAVTQVVADEVKNIESEALERVREKARDRQRRHREKVSNVLSRDVTLCNVSVTLPSSPPSMVSPPSHILDNISPPSLTSPSSSFPQFWIAYPRKVGKAAAQKAYAKAIKKAEPETILARLEAWKSSKGFPEPDFVPHASTWLNGERWLDQLEGEKIVMTETEKQDFLKDHQRRMEELWQSKSSN
jgi:hypothetical protein